MLGTPIAGALIATIGPANVLFVDAVSFVVSAALLGAFVPRVEVEPEEVQLPYLRKLREGLSAVRQDRLVLAIVSMVLITNLLDAAWATVFAPVYAREVLHSSVGLGFLFSTFGLGALTGTVVYAVIGPRLPRWPVYATAFLAVGAPRFLLLGLAPPLAVILVVSVVLGFLCGAINPILSAVEYERIPPALQSRVFGVTAAGCLVGMPVGSLLAGQAVEHLGLTPAIFGAAALYFVTTLSPFVFKVWREMERSAPEEGGRADDVQRDESRPFEPGALGVEDDEQGDEHGDGEHGDEQRRQHQRERRADQWGQQDEHGGEHQHDLQGALQDD